MIKNGFLTVCSLFAGFFTFSQVTIDPFFFTTEDEITITFDATLAKDSRASGLIGLTDGVFLWSGVGDEQDAFRYDPENQTDFNQPFEPGRMTFLGDDKWTITLVPNTFYSVPDNASITKMGLVFKNGDGSSQTEDIILDVIQDGEFKIRLNQPELPALFDPGESFNIEVVSSLNASISISINDIQVVSDNDVKTLTYNEIASASGSYDVEISANSGMSSDQINFSYFVKQPVVEESRPEGTKRGINYDGNDDTKVILCLQAPDKNEVFVVGDFNDWEPQNQFQMKKDGDFFWLQIDNLTPGAEYAYQYLIDERIYIADPYCDKILHELDRFIPGSIYPELKAFPTKAQNPIGFYNTVSVLQTSQIDYQWQVNDFVKPPKEKLVIYELLIRDFFNNGDESYQNLIDTLSYIKGLGVNAIELMPITEFSGNDSWGYNPNFMFAVDKAYGTRNDLKKFIDKAHEMGIAVILDMVLNQQEQPSPLILMDFDLTTSQVTPENPYFNVSATHPFNVFYDMNHESTLTQSFVDTVNHYWLNEYRFDGFRFDLSKGFTQTNYGEDVGAWSSYDAGRVALLKRMADEIWSYSPDAYVILEHFADNSEETDLANHGMMLWGNMHGSYGENISGNPQNIDWIYHETRGWNSPNLIGYMESHDEERQMFNAASGGRTLTEALERIKAAHAFMVMVPGPKMIWQFGELGYDISINENGRTGQKPNPWDVSENRPYYLNPDRTRLRIVMSLLNALKIENNVFTNGDFNFITPSESVKQLRFKNSSNIENPSDNDEMSAVIVANFSTSPEIANVSFPLNGTWYRYFEDESIEINGNSITEELQPAELRVYTNYRLERPEPELLEYLTPLAPNGLSGNEETNGIVLNWQNNSVILNGTNIYRKKEGEDWQLIGNTSQSTTTFVDNQAEKDNTYQYRISSFTEIGESFSNEIEVSVTAFQPLSIEAETSLSIYPNPATNKLNIKTLSMLQGYNIYKLNGKSALSGVFKKSNYEIEISTLSPGVYVLELERVNGNHMRELFLKSDE